MVCVSFCVICIVELLVSSVIAGFRACLIYICLTVYEFSFILFIHHIILLILLSVLSVTFWTLTYYKIYFFWSRTVWYETIELFILWHVWKCFGVLWVNSYQLAVHSRESCRIEQALLPHWLCNQKAYVVVVQLLTFLNLHFIMEWLLQSYFS